MNKDTCTRRGCKRPARAKGLCAGHYAEERAERLSQEPCRNPRCDNPRGPSGGYCPACYNRYLTCGDPNAGPPRRKRRTKSQKAGTRSQYHVNHAMVRKERGPAWRYVCQHCGGPAKYWATIHGKSGESPDDYMPLCGSCHWKYDGLVANLPDNTGSKRSPESRERMRQAALLREAQPGARERAHRAALLREARKRAARRGS